MSTQRVTDLLGLSLLWYLPHLAEEALTGMHDDPILAAALSPFAALSPRHAVYLMFQAMLAVTLGTTFLFARGGGARLAVMATLGAALVAEGHHALRALAALRYNSGLVTSLPMPLLGVYVLRSVARGWPPPALLRSEQGP